jgi:hypothetical protein
MEDINVGSKHETRRTTTMAKTKIIMKHVRKEVTQKEDKTWEACRRWSSGKKETDKEASMLHDTH